MLKNTFLHDIVVYLFELMAIAKRYACLLGVCHQVGTADWHIFVQSIYTTSGEREVRSVLWPRRRAHTLTSYNKT